MVKPKPPAKSTLQKRSQNGPAAKQTVTSPALSTTQARKVKLMANIPACSCCGILISDDTKALQCDRCQSENWKCIDCLSIPGEVYDQLLQQPLCGLKWYCDNCDKAVTDGNSTSRIDKLVSVVEKLVDKFADVEDKLQTKGDLSEMVQLDARIKDLENKFLNYEQSIDLKLAAVDANVSKFVEERFRKFEELRNEQGGTCSSAVEQTVKEEVIKKIDEDKDLERRKNNIIIYKIPEIDAENVSDRMDGDMAFVTEMLESVFQVKPEEQGIEKMFRLGRRDANSTTPRPLLVRLKDRGIKDKIWSNLKNLRESDIRFKGISVAHDLTPYQRVEMKKLVDQAKHEHESNNVDGVENYYFRVVGQGHKMRVMKIKRTN